jgi:hypothetical protein
MRDEWYLRGGDNKFPKRYIPKVLSKKDREKQYKMLMKSRHFYKKHKYYTRKTLKSFPKRKSSHIINAQKLYHIKSIKPSRELAIKTGCSLKALKKIVNKGEGAYYSSGSRPNQTPQSWGIARLASAITAGNASKVDFNILDKGCNHNGHAYKLALREIYHS